MTDNGLRRAQDADVPAIADLVRRAFDKYVSRIGKPPAPMVADYHRAVRTSRVWVLQQHGGDGGIVAVLVTENRGDHLLLDSIAVDPDVQGGGYGARLLERAEQDARELGLTEIRLYTNQAMTENLTYYPRHGYTERGRGRRDGFDRVFFAKPVAP